MMRMGETNVRVKEVHDQMVCGYWQTHVLYFMNKVLERRCGGVEAHLCAKANKAKAQRLRQLLEEKKGEG